MQNPHFGSKIKIPKNILKSILQIIYSCSVQKTAPKNTKYSRNETIFKIGHHAKAIAHAKSSLWVKNYNSKTHVKIHSINHIQLFCAKKNASKNTKYSRNETIFKIGHHAKALAHAKSSLWVKNYDSKTHVKIHSINQLQLFCAKNCCKKHQIFGKWDHFQNRPSCKGYSPCKILTLGRKLEFQNTCQNPFYKSFTVVLCKKPLQKTPNIREMRPFSKSAMMQRL